MLTWPDVAAIFGLLLFLGWLVFLYCYTYSNDKSRRY